MFIIPILIALGFLAFLVLSLVLMGLHRAGKLKRFRHIHLFGAVVLVAVAAMPVAGFSMKYDLSHFVLSQPGTIWSTDDGSIVLEVSDTPSGPTDWHEYDMRMLVDGEYREVELGTYGHYNAAVDICTEDADGCTVTLAGGSWHMAGSGKIVINDSDGKIVLRRIDAE